MQGIRRDVIREGLDTLLLAVLHRAFLGELQRI
jgi:hypothetical protein